MRATVRSDRELRWRRDRLTSAGFPVLLASRIARDGRWDIHRLIELVEAGCPPCLAAAILAPLDEEWHAA